MTDVGFRLGVYWAVLAAILTAIAIPFQCWCAFALLLHAFALEHHLSQTNFFKYIAIAIVVLFVVGFFGFAIYSFTH